jgi:hypothetical protein
MDHELRSEFSRVSSRENSSIIWQGTLLSFTFSGAMALALSSCNQSDSSPMMIVPPSGFNPGQATYLSNTNSAPTSPYVYSNSGNSGYLGAHGYYRIYGYPNYYDRPAPGSTVEFVSGSWGASSYRAGSSEEARESVERGGFGGGEGGEGESGHGGEGGGHGGGE